ncbi:hypothetical protein ANOM_001321 [Aspergillus nomiae NRRL 13137]|uniref:NmrA-like domain-containing protein n=1 Tax=Aspergillus nomiae NRRL (strain ATCC 15546 / NRRL 13137 / CBS 260.88 / M93) TaxID=1509407 RepID=A0A0L1JFY8_ASPN3|nr:uncharacterized protein ANOM_001321 [Aspergillus nomiae NRRL 13137]KNG90617.1 hypothetical protein ANOM_001321 [Aspergillus nomiae NRRL 13137]
MAIRLQSRRITLVGATGSLGTQVLSALLATGVHDVSVIIRPGASTVFNERVAVYPVDLDDVDALTWCLEGQEVLIMTLSPDGYKKEISLIKAAAAARVPYIIPTEFGSDPTHQRLNSEIFLAEMQRPFRALIEELGVSAWIGVVTGLFFGFNIRNGFWGLDLAKRSVRLYDDGRVPINTTTLSWVGTSLARFFSMPDDFVQRYRNQWVFFSSFLVSQRDVWESAQRATGTTEAEWRVETVDAKASVEQAKKSIQQGNCVVVFSLLFALTFQDGFGSDFSDRVIDYRAMDLTPLPLDTVVQELVEECT